MNLSGNCINIPNPIDTIIFSCPVRSEKTNEIQLYNS